MAESIPFPGRVKLAFVAFFRVLSQGGFAFERFDQRCARDFGPLGRIAVHAGLS